jgi:hypothetical protein
VRDILAREPKQCLDASQQAELQRIERNAMAT